MCLRVSSCADAGGRLGAPDLALRPGRSGAPGDKAARKVGTASPGRGAGWVRLRTELSPGSGPGDSIPAEHGPQFFLFRTALATGADCLDFLTSVPSILKWGWYRPSCSTVGSCPAGGDPVLLCIILCYCVWSCPTGWDPILLCDPVLPYVILSYCVWLLWHMFFSEPDLPSLTL